MAEVEDGSQRLLIRLSDIAGETAVRLARGVIAIEAPELSRIVRFRSFGSIGGRFLVLEVDAPYAVFLHEDVGPIRAKPGGFLVFYLDTSQDPRRSSANQTIRRFKNDDIKALVEEQRIRRRNGLPPRFIITKFVRARKGKKWFTEGRLPQQLPSEIDTALFGQFISGVSSIVQAITRDFPEVRTL